MLFLLLAVSMLACLLCGIITKLFTQRYGDRSVVQHFHNALVSLISGIALLALGGLPDASVFTIVLGLVFGLITALQKITTLQALSCGPYAYTTVISCLSTLIPALSGAIFWQEHIAPVQYVGIVLMLGCFVLSVNVSGEQKKASLKWLLYALAAFLCTGGIGVMQKWHQSTVYKMELDAFLIIAFAFSFLYSTVFCLLQARKAGSAAELKPVVKLLPLALLVLAGICVAANNKLNLFLAGEIDSAVFYPVVNGGHLVLTTLIAVVFFRERLTKRQWLGLALGTISVLLLCNPFA